MVLTCLLLYIIADDDDVAAGHDSAAALQQPLHQTLECVLHRETVELVVHLVRQVPQSAACQCPLIAHFGCNQPFRMPVVDVVAAVAGVVVGVDDVAAADAAVDAAADVALQTPGQSWRQLVPVGDPS